MVRILRTQEPFPMEYALSFQDLGLCPALLDAVHKAGYSDPTPIQTDAIPPVLAGRDVVGTAQTGTGKTAAFALPIIQRLDAIAGDDAVLRTLIVTPTRELAAQIGDSFTTYSRGLDLWHTVVFGGVGQGPQVKAMRKGVDTLIATPGRLLDLMGQGHIHLGDIEFFVLDEADRMLDMGFLPDVKRIIAKLPRQRQTLLFSATMPEAIRSLAGTMLKDPVAVSVDPVSSAAEQVDQKLFFVDKTDKRRLLVDLLRSPEFTRTLVFTRTKHGANRVVQQLEKAGVHSAAIHGNKSQGARTRALDGFKDGRVRVLVATDLAARGLDVDSVSHVINFDLPNVPETYVHRIGRTARAGASGIALSFCDVEEREFLIDIERLLGEHIERVLDHAYPPRQAPPAATDLRGARSTRSRSSNRGGGGTGRGGGRGRGGGGGRGGRGRGGGGRGRGRGRGGSGQRHSSAA